jgi:cobalt/nickel transport system ATP-binding protein
MAPLIEVKDLRFQYPDGTLALNGIDFRLYLGETVALLGANGSGKTTFVLHLNGILQGEGLVSVCGMQLSKETLPDIRRKVGLVFQEADEQLFMPTVLDDVTFGLLNLGVPPEEAAAQGREALARVGMEGAGGKAPYHLSAGEKRRVALAGVLVMRPEILILDEPTTYLDPPGQKNLLELLRELPQAKIVVTHSATLALAVAQRAVFFQKGKIAGEGVTEEIIQRFQWDPRQPCRGIHGG